MQTEYFNTEQTISGESRFRPLDQQIERTISQLCLTYKFMLRSEVSLATKIIIDDCCVYQDRSWTVANTLLKKLEQRPDAYSSANLGDEGAFCLPFHDADSNCPRGKILVSFYGTVNYRNAFFSISILQVIIAFLNQHYQNLIYDFDKPCEDANLEFWFAQLGLV